MVGLGTSIIKMCMIAIIVCDLWIKQLASSLEMQ